jgi:hypothetical protein
VTLGGQVLFQKECFVIAPITVKRAGPAIVPFLSLPEVKEQCSIMSCDTQWDSLLLSYILAAQVEIETRLSVTLTQTEWAASVSADDVRTGCTVSLPFGPAMDLPVTVKLSDGTELDPTRYTVDSFNVPGSITFFAGDVPSGNVLMYWYAGSTDPILIPQNIVVAGKMFVAHFFAHREAVQDTGAIEVPMAAEMLLAASSHNGMY